MHGHHNRLVHVVLDEKTLVRRRPEVEHERAVAIYDLIEENTFQPIGDWQGPFTLHLAMEDSRLAFDIRTEDGIGLVCVAIDVKPFYGLIKDYFIVCDSYFASIKLAPLSKIEAADMARRSLHNEGAKLLMERLKGRIDIDFDTARRLFTLVCVLHIRG
ncbi:MAG: UPF0262 family protein [Alphaproteobacteria bacterium]|nr:UPF0262 family protein [Alphaproteobacteria bacterium]MBF0356806.1 UPF0262 family protein [Alphaproteobacteria bacterium]